MNPLIWNSGETIAALLLSYHLQPGDLTCTGSPEGVGAGVAGDRIEGRVEGVASIQLNVGPAEQGKRHEALQLFSQRHLAPAAHCAQPQGAAGAVHGG